jgi:peptidoglycan/xylan/chitin deacetylase (PgdA/CDA1 family)
MYLPLAMCGAAVGLAVGGYHYAAMWPDSQLFGSTLIAGKDSAELALTYDDGPNEPYTLQLLEVLARYNVHATFFMIGEFVRQQPSIARAVRREGHVIGSHTMTHPHLMYSTRSRIRSEVQDATTLIEDVLGEQVKLFRPPFGSRRPEVLRFARERGLTPVMWNVTGFDWNASSARAIETQVERGIVQNQNRGRGTNVLLHDGDFKKIGADRRRTVSATATLLGTIPRTGMHLVTVDHWLRPDEKVHPRNMTQVADSGLGGKEEPRIF